MLVRACGCRSSTSSGAVPVRECDYAKQEQRIRREASADDTLEEGINFSTREREPRLQQQTLAILMPRILTLTSIRREFLATA